MRMAQGVIGMGVAVLVLAVGGWSAHAQTPATPPAQEAGKTVDMEGDITSDVELTRAAIQVRRQAVVTAAMDLEPKESDLFWPLYREYRVEMLKVNDRFSRLLVGYLESYETLTDQAATKMLEEYLSIERAATASRRSSCPASASCCRHGRSRGSSRWTTSWTR